MAFKIDINSSSVEIDKKGFVDGSLDLKNLLDKISDLNKEQEKRRQFVLKDTKDEIKLKYQAPILLNNFLSFRQERDYIKALLLSEENGEVFHNKSQQEIDREIESFMILNELKRIVYKLDFEIKNKK